MTAALVGLIVLGRRGWRRRVAAVLLFGLSVSPGCGRVEKPVTKLSASFAQDKVLYDWNSPTIATSLIVRNDGNFPLRLVRVDGGCSCRQVDQSALPIDLKPGKSLNLKVQVATGRSSTPQTLPFNVETGQGVLLVTAHLHAMPRHQLNPETPSHTALGEREEWAFDLVHRSIWKAHAPHDPTTLDVPREFHMTRTGTQTSHVGLAPEYAYEDVTYRLTLKDRSLGLRKAVTTLVDPRNQTLAQSSIVWQRVPFLSSVPDRILLGPRPLRIFLRCPDDSVELTKIRSTPDGVKAVVSSTREVTLQLASDAPGVINGVVEVETSATSRGPLRIPAIRYQPLARNEGERQSP